MFKEIEKYAKSDSNITNAIIARDMNQSIRLKAVQSFFENIGVMDVHHKHNNVEMQQLDYTESRGLQPIDTVAVSRGLIGFVEGSLLNECCDIIITNYRSYVVNANFEDYFN